MQTFFYFYTMCYDVAQYTKRSLDYAKRYGEDPKHIAVLEEKYRKQLERVEPQFHQSGFTHPHVLAHLNTDPSSPRFLFWGLIPPHTSDQQSAIAIANKTLNARLETMFNKPSYREAAKNQRCLITLDGFFEHHHHGGKTFPYFIQHQDESPLTVAGLWEEWVNPVSGKPILSVSIVTTQANPLMAEIHNNPKLPEPRMPLLLKQESQMEWLKETIVEKDSELLQELVKPYPEDLLKAHTVGRLRGKQAVGNVKEVLEEVNYPELQQGKLF